MTPKIISYDVEIKSTSKLWVQKVPEVYTNDSNSVEIQFNLVDCTEAELLNSTAQVLLYMQDGSFFQNMGVDVVRTGTTFSYTLKDNEGNHKGLTETQLALTIPGTPDDVYASQMYQFKIKNGLGTKVPVETFIQTWETLTTEANAFIAQMETDVQEFDVALESGVLATNIAAKLNNLETTYAPRLLSAEQQLEQAKDFIIKNSRLNVDSPGFIYHNGSFLLPLVKDDPTFDNLPRYLALCAYLQETGGGRLEFNSGAYYFSTMPLYGAILIEGTTTSFHALPSNESKFMYIADAPIKNVTYSGFDLYGNPDNPNQNGLQLEAIQQTIPYYTGGLWYSNFENIDIRNFTKHQLYSVATDDLGDLANQFITFKQVNCFGNPQADDVVKILPQAGQFYFDTCESSQAADGKYNFYADDAHITFVNQSIQHGKFGAYLAGGVYTFVNPWCEDVEKLFTTVGITHPVGTSVTVIGGNYANCGISGDGSGYMYATTDRSYLDISGAGRYWGGTIDTFIQPNVPVGNMDDHIRLFTPSKIDAVRMYGGSTFYQYPPLTNGTLEYRSFRLLAASGTVANITHNTELLNRDPISVIAFDGSLEFLSSCALNPTVVPSGKTAILFPVSDLFYFVQVVN